MHFNQLVPLILLATAAPLTDCTTDGDPADGDYLYAIVDTNQSTCYDPFGTTVDCTNSGQDGAYSGNQPSYTDNDDGTVTDNVTGLVWQQSMEDKQSFYDGEGYCEALDDGGYDDWRVPSIKELYSLIDYTGSTGNGNGGDFYTIPDNAVPYIDTDYFDFDYGDTEAGERYIDAQWFSSTVYVSDVMGGEECAFGVNHADGRIKCYPTREMDQGGFLFRCVRGHTNYGVNDLTDNGDGTVTDSATDLTWMQEDSASLNAGDLGDGTMDWQDAIDYCGSLSHGGSDNWRLPDAKELQSLVDYNSSPDTTSSAAIDSMFEAGMITNEAGQDDYAFYWTSTTHLDGMEMGTDAVYISFGRAIGQVDGEVLDVHGAGAQRGDPKSGNREDFPLLGQGPQGDVRRVFNHVRCVQ